MPSAEGISGSLSSVLNGESESAGHSSGSTLAKALGSKLKSTLIALGIGKMISDAITAGGDFESAMAKVNTLFTGSGDQYDALKSKILELSSASGLTA